MGGTIAPGLYFLTSATIFGAQQGSLPTYQFALQLTTTTFAEATAVDGFVQSPLSGTFTASGTNFVRDATCTVSATFNETYSATSGSLKRYRASGSSTIEEVFTIQ